MTAGRGSMRKPLKKDAQASFFLESHAAAWLVHAARLQAPAAQRAHVTMAAGPGARSVRLTSLLARHRLPPTMSSRLRSVAWLAGPTCAMSVTLGPAVSLSRNSTDTTPRESSFTCRPVGHSSGKGGQRSSKAARTTAPWNSRRCRLGGRYYCWRQQLFINKCRPPAA